MFTTVISFIVGWLVARHILAIKRVANRMAYKTATVAERSLAAAQTGARRVAERTLDRAFLDAELPLPRG